MHVITQETENDQLLDGGALGPERKPSILSALFAGGTLPAPTGGCGLDPTADPLDCAGGGACP